MDFKAHKISSPKGLMLDNLVYNRHGEVVVLRTRDFHAWDHPDMGGNYGFYAIPLTEEWLLKFGFEKDRNGWNLPDTRFSLTDKFYPCWLDRILWPQDTPKFKDMELKYVHQLQNLYFSLTGSEIISLD